MILERLELENFGPYRGLQVLDFVPPTDERPVVLVGGLNGGGKTTLLEAILHALYGPLAGNLIGREGSYEAFLRRAPHRLAGPGEETAVDLTFRVFRAGRSEQLRIRRAWRGNSARVGQRVTVWRDGELDAALVDAWTDFIETVVPRGVARLFFF